MIGAGAIAPVLVGLLGDAVGPVWASAATAATPLVTLPLVVLLSGSRQLQTRASW